MNIFFLIKNVHRKDGQFKTIKSNYNNQHFGIFYAAIIHFTINFIEGWEGEKKGWGLLGYWFRRSPSIFPFVV